MRDKEEHTLSLAQPVVPALGLASSMDTVFSTRNPDTTTESMASQLSDAESGSSAKTSTSGEDSAFDVDSGDDEVCDLLIYSTRFDLLLVLCVYHSSGCSQQCLMDMC